MLFVGVEMKKQNLCTHTEAVSGEMIWHSVWDGRRRIVQHFGELSVIL